MSNNIKKLNESISLLTEVNRPKDSKAILEGLKEKVLKKTDVLKFSEEVMKLTTDDKIELTEWMVNKFD